MRAKWDLGRRNEGVLLHAKPSCAQSSELMSHSVSAPWPFIVSAGPREEGAPRAARAGRMSDGEESGFHDDEQEGESGENEAKFPWTLLQQPRVMPAQAHAGAEVPRRDAALLGSRERPIGAAPTCTTAGGEPARRTRSRTPRIVRHRP
eukprot:5964971-Amphidinium_carterae.2